MLDLGELAPTDQWAYESSLYDYVQAAWPYIESAPFVDNWHIGCLSEHLQAVTTGQIKNLLINIPPGCSKSLMCCVFWPTWEWCRDPSVRFFFASYDQQLATRDSVKCRALMGTSFYRGLWPDKVQFKRDQDQKTYYETIEGGYRLATSIGGHGTGEHPDRIVADDPHNVKRAESETDRQNVIDWWDLTMPTRGLSRDARRVVIMQRLHHRDLSGHILSSKASFVHLCLPMRYEPRRMAMTPLGWTDPRREEGELLTPIQFPEDKVAGLEKSLGAYGTAGQLQQRPQPRSGGLFKPQWFNRRCRAAPREAVRIRYFDRAATADGGCYTAGVLLARTPDGTLYVEDVIHGQWEPNERNDRIVATAQKDRLRYGPRFEPILYVEAERGSTGLESFQRLAARLPGFRVREDQPSGSKDVRAEPWSDQLAAGNVVICDGGASEGTGSPAWDVDNYIQEHLLFQPDAKIKRLGKYKDQVDASCLLAGTPVTTARGRVPIELVVAGDRVLTRFGYKDVLWSGQSGVVHATVAVEFGNGAVVEGTPDHKVWTENRGWVALDALTGGDYAVAETGRIELWQNTSSNGFAGSRASMPVGADVGSLSLSSLSTASGASPVTSKVIRGDSRIPRSLSSTGHFTTAGPAGGTSGARGGRNRCTSRYGGITTVTSPMAMTFTTRTATGTTTRLVTLSACPKASTCGGTGTGGGPLSTLSTSIASGRKPPNGTPPRKALIGTRSTGGAVGRAGGITTAPAFGAGVGSSLDVRYAQSTVPPHASTRPAGRPASICGTRERAPAAARNSWPQSECNAVRENAELGIGGIPSGVPVYDLNVADAHEFFADGVLVHNSGACNLIGDVRPLAEIRVIKFSTGDRSKHPRFVICPRHLIAGVQGDERAVVAQFCDPFCEPDAITKEGTHLADVLDIATFQFADIHPDDWQDRWQEPVLPYNRPCSELLMTRDHGKAIWRFLLKDRGPAPGLFVFVDQGDRRAESVAKAVADVLRLPRKASVHFAASDNVEGASASPAPNAHVYEVMKSARGLLA